MRNLFKFSFSSSTRIPSRLLSHRLKSSNSRAARKKPARSRKPPSTASLFQKISGIVEHEILATDDASPKVLLAKDDGVTCPASSFDCRPDARGIAQESASNCDDDGTPSRAFESEKNQLQNYNLEDISLIVHKITNIVRSEKSQLRMERRLEELDLSWSSDVVEKVLKRCFKVSHLALRFFNWVTLQPNFCLTTETYNVMIFIAGEARDFGLVEKLVDAMDKELCPKNIRTWTIMISHYGKAKQIGKVLRTFEAMRKSGCEVDLIVYESILRALCNTKKPDLVMEFYNEMKSKSMVVNKNLYEMLMDCLASSGDSAAVRLVGDDMMNILQVSESDVYTRILRSFCVSGKIEEAKELFEEMKKKNVINSDVYETLVKGLCRAGKIDDAMGIVRDAEPKSVVDSKLYGCLINGFLRKGDISKSLELMQDMREIGCQPTLSTYTEIIQHLFMSDGYKNACELYTEMLKNGIEPDTVAITAMIAGHVQHNQISEAWKIFETMKKKNGMPSSKAYSVFINELCKVSKPQEALKLLEEMFNGKIKASDGIFNMVISSLNRVGELEKVKKVEQIHRLYRLECLEDQPVSQSPSHQSLDHEHEVLNIISKQDTESSETTTLNDADCKEVCRIISSYTDWSHIQDVLESRKINFTPGLVEAILRNSQRQSRAALQLFSWIGRKPGYTHTTGTYNMAIKLAGSAKDFKHMRSIFREMERSNLEITPNTWTIMIAQYGRAGLTEMALNAFQEMKNHGYQPDGSTYKYLVVFLCGKKGRKIDEAIKLFQEMIHAGYMPDREMLEIYLCSLCVFKQLVDAQRSVKSLFSRGFRVQVGYSLLIKSLCRAGRVEEALEVADEMELQGCTRDQCIYGSIVHALLREGRLDEALDKVEEMKRAGISETAHIHTSLIVHFCKEKKIAKAMEIFKKMKDDGCEPTIVTYSALIRGFMNVGMVADAWNIFRRMKLKGPIPDFETYSMFITCLCKSGKSEDALKLLHEMLGSGIIPSAINFQRVFHGLNREGKPDLAHTVLQTKWLLKRERMLSL
ncbi:hypothetical protein Cni_G17687 [Canna indica]|uniref:Pentatricopeptide repeat-containing protein n=1 Tax=Canna indica TaxID=4628 RepID=A0AAQ3KHI5_9LILI|nr:hypothetical protein Cni_G17687 [Canna indica]